MLSRDKKSIRNDATKLRTRNTIYRNSDSRLYCEQNTSRISLSSCLDVILVHLSAANFESNGRSNVENNGTCSTCVALDRYLHSTLGGTMQWMSPMQTLGGTCPPVPRGIYAPEFD